MRLIIALVLFVQLSTQQQQQQQQTVHDQEDNNYQTRRYPDRRQSYNNQNDPGRDFRNNNNAFSYNPYPADYPVRNHSNNQPTTSTTTSTTTTTVNPLQGPKNRDPFDDPNRYRIPQQQDARDNVRFVNGRPYRQQPNVQDRYGNRYDPRFHRYEHFYTQFFLK